MVITQLLGGLGNQLFQYAAARRIAYRHGVPLKLDLSLFDVYPLRTYRLHYFKIAASVASPQEIERLRRKHLRGITARFDAKVQSMLPYHRRRVLRERHFHYDAAMQNAGRKVYLSGFWQSEKYFRDIRPVLLEELQVVHPPDEANRRLLERIRETEAISMHVRRGDYVTDERNRHFHGGCTVDYYVRALDMIAAPLSNPHVFVFSDDLAWVRENIPIELPVTYVEHNGIERDIEDLRLMSHCTYHVIANSTFSWWGAWLCRDPNRRVIAPTEWFARSHHDATDVVPDSWTRLL